MLPLLTLTLVLVLVTLVLRREGLAAPSATRACCVSRGIQPMQRLQRLEAPTWRLAWQSKQR